MGAGCSAEAGCAGGPGAAGAPRAGGAAGVPPAERLSPQLWTRVEHRGWVQSVCWHPEGGRVLSGCRRDSVVSWEPDAPGIAELRHHLREEMQVGRAALSPCGKFVAVGGIRGQVRVIPLAGGPHRELRAPQMGYVEVLEWAPDGAALAVGGGAEVVRVLDPLSGEVLWSAWAGGADWVRGAAWSPAGGLAICPEGRHTRLWPPRPAPGALPDAPAPQPPANSAAIVGAAVLGGEPACCAAWSPCGRHLAQGLLREGRLELYLGLGEVPHAALLQEPRVPLGLRVEPAHQWGECCERGARRAGRVQGVAWSPSGERLAAISERGDVGVWRADGGALCAFPAHRHAGLCLGWSPCGRRLATGGADYCVAVWELRGSWGRGMGAGWDAPRLCKRPPPMEPWCSICLEEIAGAEIELHPGCRHPFHQKCLAAWHGCNPLAPCPVCRTCPVG